MSKHIIFSLSDVKELEQGALKEGGQVVFLDSLLLDSLRKNLQDYEWYSADKDVLLVNAKGFKHSHFSVFLKVLESVKIKGSIWFYGRLLGQYPKTFRSRCCVINTSDLCQTDEGIMSYLEERNSGEYFSDMRKLRAYPLSVAFELIEAKNGFMELLRNLEVGTIRDFFVLCSHLPDSENVSYYKLLFYEWLQQGSFFSMKELKCCAFLREAPFMQVLSKNIELLTNKYLEKYLFPFIICYGLGYR